MTIDDLRGLGYEIDVAYQPEDEDAPASFRVRGFGIDTVLGPDDDLDAFAAGHRDRAWQHGNPDAVQRISSAAAALELGADGWTVTRGPDTLAAGLDDDALTVFEPTPPTTLPLAPQSDRVAAAAAAAVAAVLPIAAPAATATQIDQATKAAEKAAQKALDETG